MGKKITIHQPDFMPWLGLYNKISKVDELIVLDHVMNNPRDSAFWCRRVQMMVAGKPSWISVPLVKEEGKLAVPINQMEINIREEKLLQKTVDTIRLNYARAPFFKQTFELVEKYFNSSEKNLLKRNFSFMVETLNKLHINPQIVFSSALDCRDKATHLLVELITKRNGAEYICGTGASGYQEDELFQKANIRLTYNSFQHPTYTQFNSTVFQKGLSIVDALMNVGFEGTEKLIKSPA